MTNDEPLSGTILTSTEGDDGKVQIVLYERHQVEETGRVMRHELTMYEMQHLHELLTRALWGQVRNLL